MQFSSSHNYHVLLDIVKQNITTDVVLFDTMFKDFGSREHGPVMELNKKFLRILNDIVKNTPKTRKVSFDQQCDTHKQNFLSYAPKTPPTPRFADTLPDEPLKNIDDLVKDTIAARQYEIVKPTQSINQPIPIQDPVLSKKILDIQPNNSTNVTNPFLQIAIDLSESDEISKSINDYSNHPASTLNNLEPVIMMISKLESKIDMILSKLSINNSEWVV
jgi:hypothetical protein